MDNATYTNKNCYLFAWAMEQVKRDLVGSIHFCFLVAGHTKFAPDRLFASCTKSYNGSDIINIVELKDVYTKHCSVSVCNETYIHPWRKYMGQCYTDHPGVRSLHKFLIVCGEGDKVIFRVGHTYYDPLMDSGSMCMISTIDSC